MGLPQAVGTVGDVPGRGSDQGVSHVLFGQCATGDELSERTGRVVQRPVASGLCGGDPFHLPVDCGLQEGPTAAVDARTRRGRDLKGIRRSQSHWGSGCGCRSCSIS